MLIGIIGATGPTGRQLVAQATERGHTAFALVRNPAAARLPESDSLHIVWGDATDTASVAAAFAEVDVIVSGLGAHKSDPAGLLLAGARAATAAGVHRIVWLGALGSARSRTASGPIWATLLRMAAGKAEVADKNAADEVLIAAKATVFHAAQLTDKPLSSTRRTQTLTDTPRRVLPKPVSRATVAALMLDEAETGTHSGQVVVPFD